MKMSIGYGNFSVFFNEKSEMRFVNLPFHLGEGKNADSLPSGERENSELHFQFSTCRWEIGLALQPFKEKDK